MKKFPSPASQPLVRTAILVLLLGLLIGTAYSWKSLSRSALAFAAKESVVIATPAGLAATAVTLASAPLPPSPGQARFHPRANLSNTLGQTSNLSDVAYAGDNVYVVWHEAGSAAEIRFRASTNGGASFGNVSSGQVLATIPSGDTVFNVQVATFGSSVHVIFSSGASEATAQVSYTFSTNNGSSFSSPIVLTGGPGGSPFPDIATDGAGNVHVTLEDRTGTNDIYHRLSTDGGTTFGTAVNISNTTDESIRPRLAANGANVGVVWQENDTSVGPPQAKVLFAHSTDNGMSFSPSTNLSGGAGIDSSAPDIAYANSIHVVWVEGANVVHRSSADLGASFSPQVNVAVAAAGESIRGARVAANNMIAGIVWMIVDSANVMHGPFFRRSDDNGATFAAQQDLADGVAGAAVAPPAIVAAPAFKIAWSHSLSGNAIDAEIVFLREISCSVFWANPVSGNFATAANWSTGVVPTATDDVCIDVDGTYTVTSTVTRTINSLVLGDTGNTSVQTLHISLSSFTVSNGLLSRSSGNLTLQNLLGNIGTTVAVTNGMLVNTGTINANLGTGGSRFIDADLINDGTINIGAVTNFNKVGGVYTNNGIVNVAASRTLQLQSSGQQVTFNQDAGTLNIAGAFSVNSNTFNFNGGNINGIPTFLSGGTLNIGPGSIGAAEFSLRGNAFLSGDIAAAQTVNINPGGAQTVTAANGFTNAGTINIETLVGNNFSNLAVTNGVLINSGTINNKVGSGGSCGIQADLINNGTVNVDCPTRFNKAGGSYTNNGVLSIGATRNLIVQGATFSTFSPGSITGGGLLTLSSATFFGTGSVTANINSASSQFNAGTSPGTLNIIGNYTHGPTSHLNVELGGLVPGTDFDRINISGTAALAGILNVTTLNGFCPEGTFEIMTFGARSGDFTIKNGLTLGGGRQLTPTPGPTNYVLSSSGPSCNTAPVANDDSYSIDEDDQLFVPANLGVLANDTDPEGDTLTAIKVTNPSHGQLSFGSNGFFTYVPSANFSGTDSFIYKARDGVLDSNIVTVTITVSPVNDSPIANSDTATVVEDSGANGIDVLANDNTGSDTGETITITAVTASGNGSVAITGGGTGLSYTPNANFHGPDSFTYTISDGNSTDSATVSVTVSPVNDAPLAQNDSYSTNEDTPLAVNASSGLLSNDADIDNHILAAVLVNGPANGALSLNPDGSFTYTPNGNFFGTDSFSYKASDGQADSNVATVSISVNAVNDAPDAVEDEVTTEEDTPVNVPVLVNDTDSDNETLTVNSVSQGTNSIVVINPDSTVTYTPHANFHGVDSFSYTISDSNGGSDTTTVEVTVTPVNDQPVAVDDAANTDEDTAVQINVRANDTDVDGSDTLSIINVAQGASGTVVINPDGTVTYTPNANFHGSDNFTYTIDDGNSGSGTATVNVSIAAVNDAPDAVNDPATVLEDSGANAINVLANDSFAPDTDETLSVTAVTQGASGSVVITGGGTGISYIPNGNFNGTDTFDYTISDGNGGTDTATVSITANAVNDAPAAVNDSYSTNEDSPLVVGAPGVLANDSDVDGDALTAALVSEPANGILTLNPNGSFTYTPAANFFGSDSFTYKAGDSALDSNVATATIIVNAVNDPPDAVNDSATTNHNTAVTISVLANDTDVEGHTLSLTAVTQGAIGSVVSNPDGTVTYTPNAGASGADLFTYTISDGFDGTDTAAVNITVNPVVQSELSKFVAFSSELTWLLNGTKVFTGDVGANTSLGTGWSHYDDDEDRDRKREVRIGEDVKMLQPSSRVVGDTIWLRKDSQVYNLHYNELINKHGTVLGLNLQPLPLPVLALPALPQIMPGSQDIEVKKNKTHTIAPGRYRKITVQHGATLIFVGGIYQLSTLDVRGQARLIFRGPSEVRIKNEMDTDARTYIGPDTSIAGLAASDIIFFVAGGDDKGRRHQEDCEPGYREDEVSPTVVQVGVENTIKANVYAPNGTVWLKKGSKATGAFIGKRARIGVRVELILDSAF
jgi:VCBS repeat-containing protein